MTLSPVAGYPPITPARISPMTGNPTAVTSGSCPVAWNFHIATTTPRPFGPDPNSAGIWCRTWSANRNINAESRPCPYILSIRFHEREANQCDSYNCNFFHSSFLYFDKSFSVKFILQTKCGGLNMRFILCSSLNMLHSLPEEYAVAVDIAVRF